MIKECGTSPALLQARNIGKGVVMSVKKFMLLTMLLLFFCVSGYITASKISGFITDGKLAPGIQASILIEIMSFLITAAVIGPLTAQFVEWRLEAKWKLARGVSVREIKYLVEKTLIADLLLDDAFQNDSPKFVINTLFSGLDSHLKKILVRLNDDSECFTPDMHSASTLLRHEIYLYSEHFLDQINDAISRRNGNITFANGLPVDEKKYDKNVWLKGISHIPDNSIKLRYIDWAKILDAWNPIVKQWADSSIDIPECSRNDKYLSAKYRRIEERRSLTLEYVNKHRNTENLFANLIKLEEVTPLT